MYPPLSKGLWGCYGRHLFSGNTLKVSKPLVFITFLHIFLHILLHGGPLVACFDNFADQGPRVYVVFADSLVDLLQDLFCFFFLDPLKVWHGKALFIQSVIQDCEPSRSLLDLPCFVSVYWKASISQERKDWIHLLVLDHEDVDIFNTQMPLHFYFQIG